MRAGMVFSIFLLGCGLDRQGFESWQGQEIPVFSKMSRLAVRGPLLLPSLLFSGYQWLIPWGYGGWCMRLRPPSAAKVQSEWRCTTTPPVCLHVVDRDSFTFFYLYTVGTVFTIDNFVELHSNVHCICIHCAFTCIFSVSKLIMNQR
jgi:hypothetical protein